MNRTGPMTALLLSLALVGCADKKNSDEEAVQDDGALSPIVSESTKKEVDATSRTDWVGFDFDTGTSIAASDLAADTSWDLAFKRTSIKMNGDAVKMQIVNQDYAALAAAPKDGYVIDQPSTAPDALETTGLAFHNPAWYSYDINTHVVSSANLVYIVETNSGKHFKLKFLDYYNIERLPAYINFEYQEIEVAP